jgi:hypothetical protein
MPQEQNLAGALSTELRWSVAAKCRESRHWVQGWRAGVRARRHKRAVGDPGTWCFPVTSKLSPTLFEEMPILRAFSQINASPELAAVSNQLELLKL